MSDQDERVATTGFFDRWSQRKQAARQEELSEPQSPSSAAGMPESDPDPDPDPEPSLTDADMPPLESLDEDSDFSMFLSAGVSENLRKTALRKLFLSPAYNVRDGLCDYDDDYTAFKPLGNVVTADMRLQAERLLERARRLAGAEPSTAEATHDPDDPDRPDPQPRTASGADADPPREGDDHAQS